MASHRRLWSAVMLAGMAVAVSAQTAQPAFEVASVRQAGPGLTGGRVQFPAGGRFVAENVPLDFILQQVYGLRNFQVIVDPKWKAIATDTRYNIDGRAADPAATPAQLREMAKGLLRDRFSLKLRTETREFPVYALVQSGRGVKGLRPADRPPSGIALMERGWAYAQAVTPGQVAQLLTGYVDRQVIDRTKIVDQLLQFHLTFTPANLTATGGAPSDPGCPASFKEMAKRLKDNVNVDAFTCPSIFTAVEEQLGLKLEAQTAPLEVLLIESVQVPTEN